MQTSSCILFMKERKMLYFSCIHFYSSVCISAFINLFINLFIHFSSSVCSLIYVASIHPSIFIHMSLFIRVFSQLFSKHPSICKPFPFSLPIGVQLLRGLGWKDGQGIGPRVKKRKKRRKHKKQTEGGKYIHIHSHTFTYIHMHSNPIGKKRKLERFVELFVG